MSGIYDFTANSLAGEEVPLKRFEGQVLLIVNTASACGFTPQYRGLEALYQELHPRGFSVLGFPCNQFGAQEPGTDAGIMQFCTTTYNVTFPLASKIDVNGPNRHPVYAWLTAASNGFPGDIQWNFEKFLIGRDGSLLARYPSGTAPEDNGLLQEIAEQL